MVDLSTTNILLGVMAFVSLLEAIVLIAAGVFGFRLYRQTTQQLTMLEERHVQPLRAQATTILETVQRISARVEHSTARVDDAVQGTMMRAESAVERVDHGARRAAGTVVGVVRGVRTAIETFLSDEERPGRGVEGGPAESVVNGRPPRQPAFYPEARPDSPAPPAAMP